MKSPGGSDFAFKNEHAAMTPGPYSADKWISPAPQPGDLVLFPSYLMHAVPPNPGERRISLAFNAIPTQLENVGVEIGQLLTVAAAWLVYRAARQLPAMSLARPVTLYAIGTMAAYWSCSRIVALLA